MVRKILFISVITLIIVMLFAPIINGFRTAKGITNGECKITCARCILPDGGIGGQDWSGHYELGPWGWYCQKGTPDTPCLDWC